MTIPMKYEWNPEPLNALIDASGISCNTVADNVGISVASLYHYRRGETSPSVPALCALADYFAVPMDYLVGRCTKEQADAIMRDYAAHFMEMRRASWESYLETRRGIPKQYIGHGYEAPWPYNLLDDLLAKKQHGNRDKEEDFWGDILTDSQALGLEQAIASLAVREQDAVKAYYQHGLSLEQVGNQFNVTRERARQVIAKAVCKLRHPSRFNLILYGADYKGRLISENEQLSAIQHEICELQARKDELANHVQNLTYTREKILKEICESATMLIDGAHGYSVVEPAAKIGRDQPVTLAEMNMSVRSWNCLKRAGVKTLPDLVDKMKSGELVKIRNLGKRSILELLDKVKTYTGEDYSGVYGY